MSNPFSQLNGYNYTNPYISSHTGYNGFTGPPHQQQNQFQGGSLVNGNRQFQSANNPGQFGYLNGNNSDSNNQNSSYSNGYNSHNSSLNSSFGNTQASPGSALPSVSLNPANRNFSPGSPAFPPASPLFNPPPISPGFSNTAVYAPVLSPVTPPSSNGASPVLRKGPPSQVGSVPSRAQLDPLEELEAVTKQISEGKSGPSNLNTSGSLNRTLSPTDQFVQDLLNGKDSSSVKTHPLTTNLSANTNSQGTQPSLATLKSDQKKTFFNSPVNPAFLQNNFPRTQPQISSGQGQPNSGFQQPRRTFPSNSQFRGPNGYPNSYPNPNRQGVPLPANPNCPPYARPPPGANGIRGVGETLRPNQLVPPVQANQVNPSFPPVKVPPDRNPAFRGVFDNSQQRQLHAQLERQQQELQEKQKQLQKLQQQKLTQQRFPQFPPRPVIPQSQQQPQNRPVYPPGLQPITRHPPASLGFQPRPSISQGLHPTSQRPNQVPPPRNFRPGFPPRNLDPRLVPPNFAYQGRPRNNLLPRYPSQHPPNQRPTNGTSQHLQYLQSQHPQLFSAYQQRFGNPPNRLPATGTLGGERASRPPQPHPLPRLDHLPPQNKFQYLRNRHPELLAAYRQRNPNSTLPLRQRPPNTHLRTPLRPSGPTRVQPRLPTDSVVRVEISPDQLNRVDQQEAWKRAEAFLKNEFNHREQNLSNTSNTNEDTKTKPRNRLGSWHQPENEQIVPKQFQLELPPNISVEKLPQENSALHAEVLNPLSNLPESISIQKVANVKRERRNSAPDIARVVDVQEFLRERAEAPSLEKSPLRPIKRERLNSDPTDTATYNAADTFVERSLQVKTERLSPAAYEPLYTPASSQVGTTVTTASAHDQSVQKLYEQTPLVSNSSVPTLPSIIKTLSSKDYVLNKKKSSIFDSLDLELQSLIKEKESEKAKVKQECISPVNASSSLDINRYGLAAPSDYTTFAAEAEKESVFESDRTLSLVNFSSEISETRIKELVRVKAEVPAHPTSTPSAQIPISDRLGVDLTDNMSGNPPKLPPGISLQRTPATAAPNLPPGISIQRSGDSPQLQKLPSSIQIQRPDSNESSAGMDRLAGLGIQISRSEEKPRNNDMDRLSRLGISVSGSSPSTPPVNKSPVQNQVPDRLSGLGISVSGGPKPQGISISGGPRLPPGVNVSGGPKTPNLPPGLNISGGSPQNLPPGVNISGGPRPPQNLPPGMSISGGPRSKGPPGVNISGGPRPNMPPGVNISGGPRPNMPPGVNISGGPRPNLPPGVNVSGGPRPGNPPNVRMGGPRGQAPRLPPGVQISGGPVKKSENGPENDENDDKDDEEDQDSENEEEGEMPKENGSVSEKDDQEKANNKEDEMDTEEDEGSLKVAEDETEKDKKSSDEQTDDAQENGEKETPEGEEESEEKDTEKDTENGAEKDTENDTENDTEKDAEKGKGKEGKKPEKGKKSKPGENGEEGEGWEGYEGEGWEGYEGEEGWEGYEDEEGWEGYEGEEGWEGYEGEEGEGWEEGGEKSKEGKEKKDGKPGEKGDEESKGTSKPKEDGEEEKEEGEIEKVQKPKGKNIPDGEDEEDYDEEMEGEDDAEPATSKDTDGPQKDGDGQPNAQRGLGSLGNISISRLSKEDDKPKNKLPPGISMSPVSSMPSLPPGISISSPSVTSGPPSNLPPGISISPFKKPSLSARHSVDDDSRSVNSMDRDNFYREDSEGMSDALSIRSYSEQNDPEPLVGTETICVFCNRRCGETKPKLLTCLHSACSPCFDEKIRISIRDNSANDVVDLDGEDIQMAPEVTCPICKATTSEDEVMDNYFASADDGEDDETPDEDQHLCSSCEETAIATSKCTDCEEYLCNDCVRAHQRVKMTKDHEITVVATSRNSTANLNYCDVHRNEKLTLFCESCDTLNCRDCQLSERHRNHKYRYSHEVAPEIKSQLMQSVSDIKLKRNGLEESRQLLSTKLQEVNIKENSLLGQLRETKAYLVSKIENRHKELVTEVTKMCREKRKLLEGRKSTLDRTYWQADYGITFVNNVLSGNVTDEKMLLTKKLMSRQMKRLRRANNSVNLSPPEMEMKLDLYFQHFTGQSLHTNLDSVLKMVMSDIKVSSAPIEAPKPKPPPPAAAPSPVRQAPSTPTRGMPQSPGGVPRTSPARLNSGMVNRNLGTPQKQIVARSPGGMRQPSPVRPMMQGNRNMQGNRMGGMQPRMGQPVRGARGRGGMVQGGVRMGGQQGMVGGRGQMGGNRGRGGPIRGGMVGNQGMARGGNPQMIRGRGVVRGGVQQMGMRGGAVNRGGMQIRGGGMNKPRMIQPAIAAGARRGRPPSGTGMGGPQPLTYNPSPRSQNPQSFGQRQPKPNISSLNAGLSSSGSSWHTPTTANRPVSPPKSSDASSFKIKLPKLGGGLSVKAEANADIIALDEGPPAKIVRPNGTGNVSDALATLNRTGIQISRQDEGVDPLSGDQGQNRSRIKTEMRPNSNHIQAPDFSMLIDDEISNSPEWIQQPGGDGATPMVALNLGAMKSEPNQPKVPSVGPIKIEGGQGTAKSISQPTSRPIMEGSAQKEKADGDWCAVCHDGGDTLYCCDRCPKVYHLFCYVPPLTSEPPDDWVCLMCATIEEILSLPTKVKKGRGNLSERDLKLCRRLLFEMYNLWPESVPFRDCADLNFPQYLEKIKDPIALDVIKERLDEENPDQYSSVREFLADLRKMFRNCFLFNSKESEIYRHAKKLEEKLDQLLQMWLPEFAFDPLTDLVDKVKKSTKRPTSPQPGPSKKKRSNDSGVDFLGKSKDKKKKKKKRKRKHSDDNRSESDSDDISEGERERQDYLAALQMSLQGGEEDNDPRDGDFMPDEGEQGKGKGKGKGRGKGKRAAS